MIALIQRVSSAAVTLKDDLSYNESINAGLLIFIGVAKGDTEADSIFLAEKIANLRIFESEGKFNLSAVEVEAEALVISQFTLLADTSRGKRPDFTNAQKAETAVLLYRDFIAALRNMLPAVKEGVFGRHMNVHLINDGPVTIILDSCPFRKKIKN